MGSSRVPIFVSGEQSLLPRSSRGPLFLLCEAWQQQAYRVNNLPPLTTSVDRWVRQAHHARTHVAGVLPSALPQLLRHDSCNSVTFECSSLVLIRVGIVLSQGEAQVRHGAELT